MQSSRLVRDDAGPLPGAIGRDREHILSQYLITLLSGGWSLGQFGIEKAHKFVE